MEHPFYGFQLNISQNESTQHTMAPPPSPRPAAAQHQSSYVRQNHPSHYVGRELLPASDLYADPANHMWHPLNDTFPIDPPFPRVNFADAAAGSIQPVRLAAHTQNTTGRTMAINATEWIKNKAAIHKLWIEDDRALPETMAIMSEKHQFHASLDQYKKQFAKWKWSKYIPAKAGNWMLQKADQRKREEGKDTEFEYRGRSLTETSIQGRIERKKGGPHAQGPLDVETPSDIKYMTPGNPLSSPQEHRVAAMRTAQPAWTPPAKFDRSQPQMRLVWNGRTKADYQAQYEEGLGEERCGRPDEAEAKFRSALEGFDHLLSSTHPETVAVAYRLASFFAEHVRMQDADTVLDWLNQAHLEDFGFIHTRTLNHISNVCDMFRNWGRPEQAAELLQRVLHEADKELPGPDSTYPLTASTGQYTTGTSAQRTVNGYEEEYNPQFSIPSEGPVAPSALQAQLSQLTRGSEAGEGAEAVLLRLIKHCEQYPDKLLVHSLLCYPPLLDYYEDRDDVVKKSGTLDRAEQAVWTVLLSKNKKTRDVLVACLQLSKHLVRAARYESADETFSQIECDAQESFGSDHYRTIWFLENIGTFYQNEGRWQDAAPRFEHALAARLSRYGERHESVRRLEDALENHHFETYVPSNDEETFQHAETQRSTCKISAPEVFFLGPRPRGRQME